MDSPKKFNNPGFLLKLFLLLVLFITLALNPVSAAEVEMKSEFAQGETLLAVVSGNFLDQITRDNIYFYWDHERIPLEYEVGKINNEFYIYALLLGKTPGNYSVVIKGVRHMEGIQESSADIFKNFTITGEMADFYVKPGFIVTTGDFYLDVQNLLNKRITITFNYSNAFSSLNSIELVSGETKRINFFLETENLIFEDIELSTENTSYFVPVFVDRPEAEETNRDFRFEPRSVSVSLATDSDTRRIIYLVNTGNIEMKDIVFFIPETLEPYITISPDEISSLKENSSKAIEIIINSGSEEMLIEDRITAFSENESVSFMLSLEFIKDYIPAEGEDEEEILLPSCSRVENGVICSSEQICDGNSVPTLEGTCCLVSCKQIEKKSSTGKYIGWGIVAVILIFLIWFFKRYKRVKPKVDLLKIGQGRK